MITGSGRDDDLRPAGWPARLSASVIDYLVIVTWLAALAALAFISGRFDTSAVRPSTTATDVVAFACSVLPVWAYLTWTEASPAQASWGKRRARLRVLGSGGGRAGWGRVAVRNAVKLLPWQLAHVAVARIWLDPDDVVALWTADGLSLLIPVASVAMAWVDPLRRALHDRVAGTRVVS
jgi:uncharacterized RDD family membrane protein YckC